nr:hypothetical protein [Geodermatophilus normandii]
MLDLVELEDAREGGGHLFGRVRVLPTLEPQVVVGADPGQQGELLAPQAGDAAARPGRDAGLLGRHQSAPGPQVRAQPVRLLVAVHRLDGSPVPPPGGALPLPGPVGTPRPDTAFATVRIDVTDPDSVRRARDEVLAAHPDLDVVGTMAGVMLAGTCATRRTSWRPRRRSPPSCWARSGRSMPSPRTCSPGEPGPCSRSARASPSSRSR